MYFLGVAIGSVSEVEYFLILAKDLGYLDQNEYKRINALADEAKRMLISFHKELKRDGALLRSQDLKLRT